MGLRYCIRPATSVDVAFLAAVMDESREPWSDGGDGVPIDRLLRPAPAAPRSGRRATPTARPPRCGAWRRRRTIPQVGHLWMLACEAFDNDPEELQGLSRLVFGEMLDQFPRLENFIDSRKVRAIELLRAIGFAVEPALPQPAADGDVHLVWIDSDRLHCGGRAGLLPN